MKRPAVDRIRKDKNKQLLISPEIFIPYRN